MLQRPIGCENLSNTTPSGRESDLDHLREAKNKGVQLRAEQERWRAKVTGSADRSLSSGRVTPSPIDRSRSTQSSAAISRPPRSKSMDNGTTESPQLLVSLDSPRLNTRRSSKQFERTSPLIGRRRRRSRAQSLRASGHRGPGWQDPSRRKQSQDRN